MTPTSHPTIRRYTVSILTASQNKPRSTGLLLRVSSGGFMGGDDVQPSKYVSGLIVTTTAAAASSKVNSRVYRVRSLFPCKTDLCAILFHLGDSRVLRRPDQTARWRHCVYTAGRQSRPNIASTSWQMQARGNNSSHVCRVTASTFLVRERYLLEIRQLVINN